MSKINILNNLKNKLTKLIVVAFFCLLSVCPQAKTYSHIPLKGLFEVLKIDDIGFGNSLLHSNWIENMYQYGPGKPHRQVIARRNREQWKVQDKSDPVANLVRRFWFRRSENHQLLPTQFGPLSNILNNQLGKFFGLFINYVYMGFQKNNQDERALIDKLIKYDPEYEQYRQKLAVLWKKLIDEEYRLEDKKFNLFKEAKKLEKEKIKELQKEYKMGELKEKISRASKGWGKKKGWSKERKRLEKELGWDVYQKRLAAEKKKIFELVDQEIQNEYREILSLVKKMRATIDKEVNKKRNAIKRELFEPIQKAFAFCQTSKIYAPRTIEAILWALFFHTLENIISLEEKIKVINDCIKEIGVEYKCEHFSEGLIELYEKEDFDLLEKEIKNLDKEGQVQFLGKNYDICLHYFIHLAVGKFSPVIAQGNYGYEYEPGKISHGRPDCHETAILDAFSLLWYNPEKNIFDDTLFPEHVLLQRGTGFKKLREALKYLYLADKKGIKAEEYTCEYKERKFTSIAKLKQLGKMSEEEVKELDISEVPVGYINRSEIKQEFMNIMSEIPGIVYCSEVPDKGKVFELESGVSNIITEFNYFYGLQVQSIEQLGDEKTGLSIDSRSISFEKQKETDIPNEINLTICNHKQYNHFTMMINTTSDHTFLSVPAREKIGSRILEEGVVEAVLKKVLRDRGEQQKDRLKSAAIFALLSSNQLFWNEKLVWDLPTLHLLFYSMDMKRPDIKYQILKDVLIKHFQYYDACKEMIYNLMEKIPLDDFEERGFLGSLNRTIAKLGLHKTDAFFKKWIEEKCTIDRFFSGIIHFAYPEEEALRFYNEFIGQIEDINKGQVIVAARFWPEIMKLVVKRAEFAIDKNPKLLTPSMLWHVIDNGLKDIAWQIANNPQLDRGGWANVLCYAMAKGEKDIVFALVSHPKFRVEGSIGRFLVLALKDPEYKNIAKKILERTEFLESDICWSIFLGEVLIDKDRRLALKILNNPRCKLTWDCVNGVLKTAFDQGDREIQLKIVNHPTLKDSISKVARSLIELLIEKQYKEVVWMIVDVLCYDTERNIFVFCHEDYPERFLKLALEKGYIDFVEQVISHLIFDISQPWAQEVLDYVPELAKSKAECRQELKKVIDAIEQKQRENKKKNNYF